ncbi:MAG TPA: alanine racemase, partial [Nitrospiraceae bacterium]|nr:alanine racemase [Nitrospiraceae bacterium]
MTHPTFSPADLPTPVATIDLAALAHNVAQVRQRILSSCEILAVVKADAYGHGAVAISQALVHLGIPRLGVATLQEGIALREAGIRAPILVMGALFANQFPDMIAHRLTPVVYDRETASEFAACARSKPEPYPVHVKVDTGMGRLGLAPEEVLLVLQSPSFKGALRVEGLMTHLADADGQDSSYTKTQITRFTSIISQLEAVGLRVPLIHAANSAAIICHPSAHFTAVRPGIMLYGYHTVPLVAGTPDLKPVLTLTTKVVQVRKLASGESVSYNRTYVTSRPSRIAVLPIGYADGYSRALSNHGAVLIDGRRAPVVGRVCMDMTMVDVTDIPSVRPGHEV